MFLKLVIEDEDSDSFEFYHKQALERYLHFKKIRDEYKTVQQNLYIKGLRESDKRQMMLRQKTQIKLYTIIEMNQK